MIKKSIHHLYYRLLKYIFPYKKKILLMLSATIIYGLTEPITPLIMRPLIDNGFMRLDIKLVYIMVMLLILGFFIRGIASFMAAYTSTWLAQKVVYNLRVQMFAHLLRLPMNYYHHYSHGSIVSRFTYDVLQLMTASTDAVLILLRESITILALSITLFYLNWKMALAVMVFTPAIAAIITYISRRLRTLSHAMQEDMSGMNHIIDENLRGREIVRIYQGETFELNRFTEQADSVRKHAIKSRKILEIASPTIEVIIVIILSMIIIFAALQAKHHPNQMTPGVFISFLTTMVFIFPPIKRLSKLVEPLQRGLAAAQSIFAFLDTPIEVQKRLPATSINQGTLRFERVSFYYDESPVLSDFSLTIHAGETLALVGESGSGKSTIAALIAGFHQPQQGSIFFDGQNVNDMTLTDRRNALAYVSQQTVIFSGSVIENVAYADPNPDIERVRYALHQANAEGFIHLLDKDIYSTLGEQGNRLSGGQKQRIAIARALYKSAPILILDEATSALDTQSEHHVQEAINRLHGQRTVVIIAHRLSTVRNADRIVVLSQGQIIESGNHDELMARDGVYAKLLAQNQH